MPHITPQPHNWHNNNAQRSHLKVIPYNTISSTLHEMTTLTRVRLAANSLR